MIQPHWKRIAGLHIADDGAWAAVWMALDENGVVHLYDCAHFKREVLAVIAEGLNARGRFIPVAWTNESMSQNLLDRGCNMLPEKTDDSDEMAEVISRDILERMRTGRFKVEKRLSEWLEEFRTFNRDESKVPSTHPLMTATRYAMSELQYGRAEKGFQDRKKAVPKLAIV